jgi:hypothetical protein
MILARICSGQDDVEHHRSPIFPKNWSSHNVQYFVEHYKYWQESIASQNKSF